MEGSSRKVRQRGLWISVIFEVRYRPYVPRGVTALDANLRQIATYDGCSIRRYRTRFVDALSKRARAEDIQRKYCRRWRYNVRILNRIRSLHRRARNIVIDWCRKLAKKIITKARKRKHAVALEDLTYLQERNLARNGSEVVWRLTMFAYRKLHESIMSKAVEYNVPIILVNPRETSKLCPRCKSTVSYVHRLAICRKCNFITDRDVIGAINIWLKSIHAYAGVPGSPLSAPPVKDETRQRGRTINEGMKKVIKSI